MSIRPEHLLSLLIPGMFLVTSCKDKAASTYADTLHMDSSFTVQGTIKGLDSGYVFFLNYESEAHEIDSARVVNGHFTYTGKADTPRYYYFSIESQPSFRSGFFAENTKIHITGDKDSADDIRITGGPVQEEYNTYLASQKKIKEEGASLSKAYDSLRSANNRKGMDSIQKVFDAFGSRGKDLVKGFAKDHPASIVAAFEMYDNFSYDPDARELDSTFNFLNTEMKGSFYGKKLAAVLEIAKKTSVGSLAPEFSQPDPNGKLIALSTYRQKYVLIDFWASWCGPCRAENPHLLAAYNKFHGKGFDILGVSLDDDKAKWLNAVQKDKLAWLHVSDLKGWKNDAAKLYSINAIPMNYLLDKEGRIIAKGIRGEDLDRKLDELMR